MNLMIAAAILAWCEAGDAVALPQIPGFFPYAVSAALVATGGTSIRSIHSNVAATSTTANAVATGGLAHAKPLVPGSPGFPHFPAPVVAAPGE
jgi:hypothetical protein